MRLFDAITWLTEDMCRAPWHLTVNTLGGAAVTPRVVRWGLYRLGGLHVKTPSVLNQCYFTSKNLYVGRRTFINYGCRFVGYGKVQIGTKCAIGPETLFITSSHYIGTSEQRCGDDFSQDIFVGNGVWIGARCTILPGVRIGEGAVVAAGAVVTKSCKANCVFGGVPAKWIRDIEDDAHDSLRLTHSRRARVISTSEDTNEPSV